MVREQPVFTAQQNYNYYLKTLNVIAICLTI